MALSFTDTYSLLMPRIPRVTAEQREVLEELSRAATLRSEAQRYYLRQFWLALEAGVGTSVIGRYTGLSPQAANSAKNRLAVDGLDDDAPRTVREVLKRAGYDISALKKRPVRPPNPGRTAEATRADGLPA